jgi:hypothetical protein
VEILSKTHKLLPIPDLASHSSPPCAWDTLACLLVLAFAKHVLAFWILIWIQLAFFPTGM